jgi:hypothetical protein
MTNASSESEHHRAVDFDGSEIQLRVVVGVLLGIAVVFAMVGWGSWRLLNAAARPGRQTVQPHYRDPDERMPAPPRLQPLGDQTLKPQYEMQARLSRYGRTDTEGFLHVPIDDAISIAARQLPASKQTTRQGRQFGLFNGGESSSGRVYQEAPSWLE